MSHFSARGCPPPGRYLVTPLEPEYMHNAKTDIYLTCSRRKGHHKKHISVCRKCRWQKSCKEYQAYLQPQLPVKMRSIAAKPETRSRETVAAVQQHAPLAFMPVGDPAPDANVFDLLRAVKRELMSIRALCAESAKVYQPPPPPPPPPPPDDPPPPLPEDEPGAVEADDTAPTRD